ncbi:CBS domain-containing protein [Streptomyces sp. NBC_01795]|nr:MULTISPECIES: CBS domain-containing protein [unclassified Streptomyces]WSA97456.1 CBS domain-containing protein [Streptomyces sp. NBC_01795]WSB81884.1 CBS domain-containing protein [Streptomyces sp. NBC_01775]WSS17355.1 CBS domain-containing protein [Streptomyces sp. NBC_01186]WSS46099.1 CBS domain-containing protein [Streptomyces sp. NBC_01187]
MTTPGPQAHGDMSVDVALSVLSSARAAHLLIRDEDGRCTGLVTAAQLAAHRSGTWYTDRTRLHDIAHDRGPFIAAATSVHEAERAMRARELGTSPVIDPDGYALGVLALSH